MASRRCGLCGIEYPPGNEFRFCPVHGEPTKLGLTTDVDENWEWAATLIAKRLEQGTNPEQAPPLVKVGIYRDEYGEAFLAALDLIRAGVTRSLELDDVVEIVAEDGKTTLYEVMGQDNKHRRYWVRRICFDWPENCQ